LKKVQPKQEKYEEVKAVLDEAKAKLKQKMDELDAVKSAVAKLEADC
jgi:isoaspartyl peptidase/L-asparaginase-like protein (Ntn-hydrolase superfamily)